jgi:hypothetical protein
MDITEHFEVGGAEYCQEMAIGGQRYHRVTAPVIHPGFKCRSSNKFLLKPWVSFTRAVFVKSDLLARLAKREFNQNESGFYRVTLDM